jgi:hypothetical protein
VPAFGKRRYYALKGKRSASVLEFGRGMWINPGWSAILPQIPLMRRLKAVMDV